MAPKKKAAAAGSSTGSRLFDLGVAYGEHVGRSDDPWSVINKKASIYGNFWGYTGKEGRARYPATVAAYNAEFPWSDGKAAPAYYVEAEEYYYPMRPEGLARCLPPGSVPHYVNSEDEEDAAGKSSDEENDQAQVAARKRKPSAARAPKQAETFDASRPGHAVHDEVLAAVDALHGQTAAKGQEGSAFPGLGDKDPRKYTRLPTGWRSPVALVTAALTLMTCTASGPKLKNPAAQGITRNTIKSWRLVDSFNKVYPPALRQHCADHFNLYRDFKISHERSTVRDKQWPQGGVTRRHYDAYIAVIGIMGIVHIGAIENYWNKNSDRYSITLVRKIMPRDLWQLMRRYSHYNDASKKVQRGDRAEPAPAGYDPIYNFRPMVDGFNAAWKELVTLPATLTIDEKMIKLAMRTGLSRRQPNKPIRDGLQARAPPFAHRAPRPLLTLVTVPRRCTSCRTPRVAGSTTRGSTRVRAIPTSCRPTTSARRRP